MEGHVTTIGPAGTGSGSVAMVTDSAAADPDLDLRVLCDRIKILEQNASSISQSDSYLQNRIKELESSEKTLLSQLSQLAATSHLHWPSMQHSQRLDQRLHALRDDVRTMTREKERGEQVWRERLQRCQNQLRAKEEEMSRQSQYFQNFKAQLQHKLTLARDREQSLQTRVHALEKQLLDMTVAAATNMATITAVGITTGSILHREEQETTRLPYLRGEGEGEEEEGGKKRQQRRGCQRRREREGDQGEMEEKTDGEKGKETNRSPGEARLQGFILSLQEDLRVLLEREEQGVAEQRRLTEQLQEAQENGLFLACTLEEMRAEVHRLELSESSLMEEVEELREENQRLHQHLREVADQVPSQTPTIPGSGCTSPGPSSPSPSLSPAPSSRPSLPLSNSTATGQCSADSSRKAELTQDEPTAQPYPAAPPPVHQQGAAENSLNNPEDHSSSSAAKSDALLLAQPDLLNLSAHLNSKPTPGLLTVSLATETVDVGEFSLGAWCSGGALSLEQGPSKEADALREAYRSLGLGDDLEDLREQRDRLEDTLRHMQEQLHRLAQENARLKLQLREEAEEQGTLGEEMGHMINMVPTQTKSTIHDVDDLPSPLTHDDDNDDAILTLVARDDLARALNRENRSLACRIQEMLAHAVLREGESARKLGLLREQVSRLEADGARLEQENQEQGCLITELTRKTEDDLNTIMDLRQKIEDSGQSTRGPNGCHHIPEVETCGGQVQSEYLVPGSGSGSGKQKGLNEGSLDSPLEGEEEPGSASSQQADRLTTDSAHFSHQDDNDNRADSPGNSRQGDSNVSLLTNQVDQLTQLVHGLKNEREELIRSLSSLREEEKEAALSVQSQTEEKQQLTRAVWGLKEERDHIAQSLHSLKQERDQLTRIVCGLKDERDQFIRSMSGLREEREQLTELVSGFKEEREKLLESLSSEKEERDQITQSRQSLQKEMDQLSQSVVNLKRERDELTESVQRLKEQRDQEQSSHTSKEERDELLRSVCSLKEEKEKIEDLLGGLKKEKQQISLSLSGLREERDQLQTEVATLHSQSLAEGWSQKEHLSYQSRAGMATRTEIVTVGTGKHAAQRNQTTVYQEKFAQDEKQSDLLGEIEALGAELRKSREELDKTQFEAQSWYSELVQSEARREEAEQRAAQAANEVMRMTDLANQLEETRRENDRLTSQVKELQSRLTGLAREKADALSLKTRLDQQFNVLQAQLKAKTVALEELNSEYTALRRDQGSKEECSTTLTSLRTRYDDIRAKYDVLLKRKSQTDLDIAPLKAKVSCLVLKCQERNSLLVQMMRTMRRQGCLDLPLAQQAEHLLSDAALQDYTAAFTAGAGVKTQDCTRRFTPGSGLKLPDYTNELTPDRNHTPGFTPGVKEYQIGFSPVSNVKHQDTTTSGNYIGIFTPGSTAKHQDCSCEFTPPPLAAPKDNANSPVPTNRTLEHANVQKPPSPVGPVLKEGLTNVAVASCVTQQTPPSANKPIQATAVPDRYGAYQAEVRGEISLAQNGTTLGSAPPSLDRSVSLNRRLSSPEKIINIHQQLQKTLSSSYQASVRREVAEVQAEGRGRGQQSRRGLSDSASGELSVASQIKSQSLSINSLNSTTIPVTAAPGQAKQTTLTNKPTTATHTPTTLFTLVASRSANVTFSPSKFAHTLSKAASCNVTTTTLTSSPKSAVAMTPHNINSSLGSSANSAVTPNMTLPKPTRQTAIATVDTTKHTSTTTVTTTRTSTSVTNNVSSAATVPSVLACTVTSPTSTASNNTAPTSTAPEANTPHPAQTINPITAALDITTPIIDGGGSATPTAKSASPSPEKPSQASSKSSAHPGKGKAARPKPEAPAEVGSVEVIRTVGQNSLMIGWERPLLDELGCSNGTFVYGYRVYVDGEFHKSVMSSACTKCILENVDLSVPVHIGVQTLGSNGLGSSKVHTIYRTSLRTENNDSFRTDRHPPPSLTGSQPSSPGYKTPPSHRHSGLSQQSSSSSSKSNPPSPAAEARTCVAIYSYSPLRDSPNLHPSRELTMREGDTVTLLGNPRHDGFCEAQVNGRRGLAPMAVLEELLVSEPRPMYYTS